MVHCNKRSLSSQHPRQFPIFRPHWHERPTQLLQVEIETEHQLDDIRIAKHQDAVIAAYRIKKSTPIDFELLDLAVLTQYQNLGLENWMVLHAVGLIESRGGRKVHARLTGPIAHFLTEIGFSELNENRYLLELTPE